MKNKLEYPKDVINLKFDDRMKQNVLNGIQGNQMKRRKTRAKRFIYPGVAAAVIFAGLIGSSYFSVGAAKVAAKIPYFSIFIKQEEYKYALYDVIGDAAVSKGYKLGSIDSSIPKKEITLGVLYSKKDFNHIKDEIEKNLNKALVAKNFGKYDITLKRQEERVVEEDSPDVKKYIEDSVKLEQKIIDLLEKNHYQMAFPVQVRINQIEKFIYVAIPKTETKPRVDELKKMLVAASRPYGEFTFRVSRIDMKARAQEQRWDELGIIQILGGGLMENKEFKVTGYSYSFHPLPLQLEIKTSIKSTDSDAKEQAATIVNEINSFIQTDGLTKKVRNDPYEITVFSKDKKKLN
ncbi:DUF4030 domain-containing protein [Neobacillus sp. KR4-4]|uniref:DUF4030 domain-containing protein n=1 Tax=Neobacillus sp. KR4-4 TaxID=3344872 RepID=UPI0035CC09EA